MTGVQTCALPICYEDILFDLIGKNADVIGMSVYIWNARICLSLLEDLRRLHPSEELVLLPAVRKLPHIRKSIWTAAILC